MKAKRQNNEHCQFQLRCWTEVGGTSISGGTETFLYPKSGRIIVRPLIIRFRTDPF
jgi:hypothetical protein